MARNWGNDDHGPGGDPSWLGGKDRDPSAQSSGGQSSDFSSQGSGGGSSDFSPQPPANSSRNAQGDPAQQMAPRFGQFAAEQTYEDPSQWRSDFADQRVGGRTRSRRRGRGSTTTRVGGLLTSLITLLVFAGFAHQMGMAMWWAIPVIGIPLLSRGIRTIRRNLRS